jgi:ketosteroid isomerase-like protein
MSSFALLGGVLGLALARYENRAQPISTATTSAAPEETRQKESSQPLSLPVTNPAQQTNDVRPGVPDGSAPTTVAGAQKPGAVEEKTMSVTQTGDARATLRNAFDEWIAATNARDLQRQMNFYQGSVNAFYLQRNVPRAAVRAEKSRVFDHADLINIRAAAPGINMSPDGRAATMRFRKKYAIEGGGEDRRGEVIQELRWVRTDEGWKIVSERDLHVIQ